MRALVTGATGFIGRHLVQKLTRPAVLSRDPERARRALGDVEAYTWNPMSGPPPAEALAGIEVVFHLAGEPVADRRWTAAQKARIHDSRVVGTRNLVAGIEAAKEKPRLLISGSAVGYYGDRGDEVLEESSAPGNDFLAQLSIDWETESLRAAALGIRVVIPRTGIVLGAGGGALGKMLLPFKLGLGGRLASGRQWMPWIHLDDEVGLLLHAAERSDVNGPMNAVAPEPVTNREFTRNLASVLKRPAIFPVPKFALSIALGEVADVLLSSQRVLPRVAEKTGYQFRFRKLEDALRDILQS